MSAPKTLMTWRINSALNCDVSIYSLFFFLPTEVFAKAWSAAREGVSPPFSHKILLVLKSMSFFFLGSAGSNWIVGASLERMGGLLHTQPHDCAS